jgi:serine/threonine protein phosphatase PrpC
VASALAVGAIAAYVKGQLAEPEPTTYIAALLQAAIHTADEVIWTTTHTHRELAGMGTTVVLALCQGDQVHIAHVGDSRAYFLHDGELRQLTEDHSVVAQLIEAGQLTPRKALSSPPPSDHPQSRPSRRCCRAALRHLAARGLSAALLGRADQYGAQSPHGGADSPGGQAHRGSV